VRQERLPLEGVTVLDCSRLLPGPWAAMTLADFGADVIKVEEAPAGDYSRVAPPMYGAESVYYLNVNRGKRGIVLDLKQKAGQDVLRRLARKADVLVESWRPGVAKRRRIDYASLRRLNPRLVYCSVTGYGQDGPYGGRGGHDLNIVGLTGLLSLTNNGRGTPRIPCAQLADMGGGAMPAVIGILLALLARGRTGRGQQVDANMLEGLLSWLAVPAVSALARAHDARETRRIEAYGGNARYNIYRTRDRKSVTLAVLERHYWEKFCRAVDREDLIDPDESPADRLTTHGRLGRRLFRELRALFRTRDRDDWVRFLQGHDVPCYPVYEIGEVFDDPQVRARGLVRRVSHPTAGAIRVFGPPVRLSEAPARVETPPPRLGEHTNAILREMGFGTAEIRRLAARGIVQQGENPCD
jgi:crotonobetainyl-CoA:carnitine CoA-transferase CaiB-like acyl-CoA transferase